METQKDKEIDELISLLRKISNRMMNLHKIYSFNLILDSNTNLGKVQITNVHKKEDIENSKMLFGNILLRCESIVYFFIKMKNETILENGEHNKFKNSKLINNKIDRIHMKFARIYMFLFDNIINQIISLFDYVAYLYTYILIGQHAKKRKWNNSLKKNEIKFKDFSSYLNKINNEFINNLADIRADIFHSKFLGMSTNFTKNFMDNTVEMEFKIDKKFQKFLIKSKLVPENSDNIEILDATFLITKRGFEYVINILEKLKITIYKINLEKNKQTKPISDMFVNAGFQTVSDVQKALLYHWGFFWDDTEQFEKLDYINREMNKILMPFRFYPEE